MAKKKNDDVISISRDDFLAKVILDAVNDELPNSAFILGNGNTPTDVKEFVSTGSSLLDLIISNRPYGGIPVGRISLFTGFESTGKSLLAAHLLASTQKKNGIAILIDNETSYDSAFLTAIGVDIKKLGYIHVSTIEEMFTAVEKIISKVRDSSADTLLTIICDSLAAMPSKTEIEGSFDKQGWNTEKAIVISRAMRKLTQEVGKQRICLVFTNQLRSSLSSTWGDNACVDPYTTKIKIRYKI